MEDEEVGGGGFLMCRTKRLAFSGASPFPEVEQTTINACRFILSDDEDGGG